jgi:hypothetical protein
MLASRRSRTSFAPPSTILLERAADFADHHSAYLDIDEGEEIDCVNPRAPLVLHGDIRRPIFEEKR